MNDTQWTFELWSMNKQDEERFKETEAMIEVVETKVARALGIDLMPVEDPETHLLRRPERGEYVPFLIAAGREDFVKAVIEKRQEFETQEDVRVQVEREGGAQGLGDEMSPEELEKFMQSDAEGENTPAELKKLMSWGGRTNQILLENLVLAKEDVDSGDPLDKGSARTLGKARQDLVKQYMESPQKEDLMSVKLSTSPAPDDAPTPKDRIKVVLKGV